MSVAETRLALSVDAPGIVETISEGFPPEVLGLTVYGCPGIARFVRHQIEGLGVGTDTRYVVACTQERIDGCAEVRILDDALFLNYISVRSHARSKGLGRLLLGGAIDLVRGRQHRRMFLDVLENNTVARTWYGDLGFDVEYAVDWWDLPSPPARNASSVYVRNYPQAEACQDTFGFSQFALRTLNGLHDIGRLGVHWFRVTDPVALTDPAVAAALGQIDPSRRVLAVLREGLLPTSVSRHARLLARTWRMGADLDVMVERLKRGN